MKSNFLRGAAFAAMLTTGTGCEEPTTRPVETPRPTQEQLRQECVDRIATAVSQDANRNLISSSQLARQLTNAVIENVCDGEATGLVIDKDGDGYVGRVDCDDTNAAIHPGSVELCDGVDNNCNGLVDDIVGGGRSTTFYRDADGDGFVARDAETVEACVAPEGFIQRDIYNTDCNDQNAGINPDAVDYPVGGEINGVDENCDGIVDGGYTSQIPTGVEINREGVTIGGILNATVACDTLRCAGREVKRYLDDSGILNEIESLIYSDNALTRALLSTAIDANVRVFITLNNEDREKVATILSQLNAMLDYARTVDLAVEQAYYDSLAEDQRRDFIDFGPGVIERTDENFDPNREYQAMVFRRLRAGADRDQVIWGLERATSEIEEGTRLVRITETEGSGDTTVAE